MNVLIVSQHFYPETFRINEIAERLVAEGNTVDVVTGLPNYPEGEIYAGYENKREEDYHGVHIHRTKIRPRHHGSFNLFLNYVSFMLRGKKTVRRLTNAPDVILCYQTSPAFQLLPAATAKKKFHCPLLTVCLDQWPVSLSARGLTHGLVYDLIGAYCKKLYQKSDFILNVSPSFIDYNHRVHGISLERMDWMIQHCEDNFKDVDTSKHTRDTVDLLFAGNVGRVQNVEDIVRAYAELKYDDLFVHVVGDGSALEGCKALASDLGVADHVLFYGRVPVDDLLPYYKKADACLLTLSGKTAVGNTVPAKLPGYFSASKPVLGAVSGDAVKIIEEAKAGRCAEPDDYKALSVLMDDFYRNKKDYADCGANARLYFEDHCTVDVYMQKLNAVMRALTEK